MTTQLPASAYFLVDSKPRETRTTLSILVDNEVGAFSSYCIKLNAILATNLQVRSTAHCGSAPKIVY